MKRALTVLLSGAVLLGATGCFGSDGTYTVSYAYDGKIYEIAATEGKLFRMEEIPQKEYYDFAGLFDSRTGGTQIVDESGVSVSTFTYGEDLVLYPQFQPKQYRIVFDYRGGSSLSGVTEVTAAYGETVPALPLDVVAGEESPYEFAGWYTETDGAGEQIADDRGVFANKKTLNETAYNLTADGKIYLFAHYAEKLYRVTFRYGDGKEDAVQAKYDASIADLSAQITDGGRYVLQWSARENDWTGEHVVSRVQSDVELYPCKYGYAIQFITNSEDTLPVLKAEAGVQITLPTPQRAGYEFLGWQTGAGEAYTSTVMPSQNLTLSAAWRKLPVTITFAENGGSATDSITAEAGSPLSLPACTRFGYAFAGWYTAGGSRFTDETMPQESLTLTARWQKQQSVRKTITSGEVKVNSSKTGILFEIDLSEYLDAADTTSVSVSVTYNLKVNSYIAIGAPHWFDMKFYTKRDVNSAYLIGEAVCDFSGEYGSVNGKSFSGTLQGNRIYIAADSNTWAFGYNISDFSVTVSFTENKLT